MNDFDAQAKAFSEEIEAELHDGKLSFPTVLQLSLRIKQVADDPASSLEQIARLVRVEPVLSLRVIQMANSVIFNPWGNSVSNATDAIQRIGVTSTRMTALTVAAAQVAGEQRSPQMRELALDVWKHSIDVAAWAFAIARRLRVVKPDTALLAGLMTDIAPLFLLARVARYPAVAANLAHFSSQAALWSDALTQQILKSMGLPEGILDAMDFDGPYPGNWPPKTLKEVLFAAGLAADADKPFDPLKGEVRRKILEIAKFQLDEPKFDELLCEAEIERDELLNALRG